MSDIKSVKELQDLIIKRRNEVLHNNSISVSNAEIEDLDFDTLVDENEKLKKYNDMTGDGYNITGFAKTADGIILMGEKEGSAPKLYLLKGETIQGSVVLDLNSGISSTTYDESQNTITVKTTDGKTHIYNADRVSASIALAQKYEGTNSGKYYATDGEKVVEVARTTLGKEYIYGACSPDAYDCSGLVAYCVTGKHERIGTTHTFMEWPETNNPEPGDICVSSGHTGIYIGDGQMIHAATEGVGVIIGPVQGDMKYVKYPGDDNI